MRGRAYHRYLKSPEWAVVRRLALEQADHRCRICAASDHLDVHHRTYERVGEERLADVVVLCRDCHAKYHADAADSLIGNGRPKDIPDGETWIEAIRDEIKSITAWHQGLPFQDAIDELVPLLWALPDTIERNATLIDVADRLGMDRRDLVKRMVN